MQWLEPTDDAPAVTRPGPPRLPGAPAIPPMPVTSSDAAAPTNKTIEVDPRWLEQVEERRAKKTRAAVPPPAPPRPRAIIPREDE